MIAAVFSIMIKIDGSHGEGGGQIIRTALALSTVLQVPFKAENIRQGRKQPVLKAQHLSCIKALQQLCNAKVDGDKLGSDFLLYVPGEIKSRKIDVDIGTAGSITLLLQSLLVPCFFANHPVTLKIKGGTSGKWQMPFDYFENIFAPQLRRFGQIKTKLHKRGYYPKGGGFIEIKVDSKCTLNNFDEISKINLIEQGTMVQIKGISHASKLLQEASVAERQANAAKALLLDIGVNVDIRTEYCDTLSPGSGITMWAVFSKDMESMEINPIIVGTDVIGEKGKPSEEIGGKAAKKLISEIKSDAPVDEHLADNLIPFLAMFGGKIKVSSISSHTRTNIYAVEQFLGNIFEIDEKEKIILCNLGK